MDCIYTDCQMCASQLFGHRDKLIAVTARVVNPLDPAVVVSFTRFLRGANRSLKTVTIYTDATRN